MTHLIWICHRCAEKLGGRMEERHLATYHTDKCDVCGETVAVTEPRDYGLPSEIDGGKEQVDE